MRERESNRGADIEKKREKTTTTTNTQDPTPKVEEIIYRMVKYKMGI